MRFHGLDLNLLVALDALLTDQNVSVAAERIHLSQSAMSGALNRLREYFKDELLVPMGRRMVLTARAEQLAPHVHNALLQIKATITTRPDFDPLVSDRAFSIVASDYAILVGLAQGLEDMQKLAPSMSFDLQPVGRQVHEKLERGEIDFLITIEKYVSRDHPHTLLFEDDYVVVSWSGNDTVRDRISEEMYFDLGHVIVKLDDRAPMFDEWFLQSGLHSRRAEVTVPHFSLAPYLVVGTNRIATMHRRLAEIFAKTLPLRLCPVPFDIPVVRQMIQWHQVNQAEPATHWIRSHLERAFRAA